MPVPTKDLISMNELTIRELLQLDFDRAFARADESKVADRISIAVAANIMACAHLPTQGPSNNWWVNVAQEAICRLFGSSGLSLDLAFAAAASVGVVEPDRPLGAIPALLCEADGSSTEVRVDIFQKPRVSPDGSLVLGVRVPRFGATASQKVQLLVVPPSGKPLEPPVLLRAGGKATIVVALPPDLRDALRDIEGLAWDKLPIRFLLRPEPGPAQAAGSDQEAGDLWSALSELGRRMSQWAGPFLARQGEGDFRILASRLLPTWAPALPKGRGSCRPLGKEHAPD